MQSPSATLNMLNLGSPPLLQVGSPQPMCLSPIDPNDMSPHNLPALPAMPALPGLPALPALPAWAIVGSIE